MLPLGDLSAPNERQDCQKWHPPTFMGTPPSKKYCQRYPPPQNQAPGDPKATKTDPDGVPRPPKWAKNLFKNQCIFQTSKNNFLSPRDRFQTPKSHRIEFVGLFLASPWILRGPQNHPKSATWHKMASQKLYRGDPGTNLLRRPSLKHPGHHFGWFVFDFWLICGWFVLDFWLLVVFLN